MTKHIYGYDYEVVSTESAKRAILNRIAFNEIDEHTSPEPASGEFWEQRWWDVAKLNEHDELWMNNCDGEILILTDGPESYYRRF